MYRGYKPILLSLTILCSSCGARVKPTNHHFRTFLEDGVQVAESSGGPKYESELFQYEKELVIPAGTTEETALGLPRQFFSDSEGYFYIVDDFRAAVLVYRPDGQYSHTIGRKGYGPGELQQPRVQEVRDGVVSLFDLTTRRLLTYQLDGKLINSVTAPNVPGIQTRSWNARAFHVLPNGNQVLLMVEQDFATSRNIERIKAILLSPESDSLAEVSTSWIKTTYTPVSKSGNNPPPPLGRPYPYGPQLTCTPNSQVGIVLGAGLDPVLHVYDFNANIIKEVRIIEEPIVVDTQMKQRISQAILEQSQSSEGFFQTYWRDYMDTVQFPETVAFSSDIEVEDSGYIWIKVPEFPTAVAEYADSTWRLISPDGEYLGTTKRPEDDLRNPPGTWRRVFNGRLLIVHQDEDTGEWLPTVYRIRPIPRKLTYPN